MPIRNYLEDQSAFDPLEISIMSRALQSACTTLQITPAADGDRKAIAERIIDLARSGVTDPKALSDRVIAEAQAHRSL